MKFKQYTETDSYRLYSINLNCWFSSV
jgi:hypothetical protein